MQIIGCQYFILVFFSLHGTPIHPRHLIISPGRVPVLIGHQQIKKEQNELLVKITAVHLMGATARCSGEPFDGLHWF